MSGDVQPRKRKDKKRKKASISDELGIEEPRGTAAVLGEGDVFMHSQHDHGTGGHWCAKIIFFSLLAILVTLIGLIILENRGLSELEANSVESRYSGVLDGWLEDAPDDDHHDEHTLELNHDDEDEGPDENGIEDDHHNEDDDDDHDVEANEDDEYGDEADDHSDNGNLDEDDEDESNDGEDAHSDEDDNDAYEDAGEDDDEHMNSEERDLDENEDDDEEHNKDTYEEDDEETGYQMDEAGDYDDHQEVNENYNDDSDANDEDNDDGNEVNENESNEDIEEDENEANEEDEEHDEENEEDEEVEVEKLEQEPPDDLEPVSTELPALPEEDDDDDEVSKDEDSEENEPEPKENDDSGIEDEEEEEFLEADDDDELPVEKITVPAGKPFVEVEEEISSEQPPDTLEEEEEYEKRQEELRKEEAQASHMWLKLSVGAALLVATHAVMRRATHSRDEPEREEHGSREETPLVDRRLTLIPEEAPIAARKVEQVSRPVVAEEVVEKVARFVKSVPITKQESEEEDEEPQPPADEEEEEVVESNKDKELYSEEEPDEEIEEEEEVVEIVPPKKEVPKQAAVVVKAPEPEPEDIDDEDPEDVEIIGDEQLEEEVEEEEELDEEDISDVDDAELLNRLEAKYGKLPDEKPKQKDGGNSIDDLWPGEPSDAYWRQQLDSAEQELRQGAWTAARERAGAPELRGSARARYVTARAIDLAAEARRDNRLLAQAIAAYLDVLKMNEHLADGKLLEVAGRALDRIQFRGTYLSAEPVYRLLIRRFPNEPAYRNNLTVSFLMANRVDLAESSIKETLKLWPNDRLALAHHGFVLKTKHKKYEEAAEAFKRALEGDSGPANEPRFYYHYGDSLLLLGRHDEARLVHERGAKLGHFLSASQRSLYNVDRLQSTPWWDVSRTPYASLARDLEKNWKAILKEGEAAKALYELEKEGLKDVGEWSQLDLFVRGQEVAGRCARAPVTCGLVRASAAAAGCRRGQVKFSLLAPGSHVRAHVGPTNCRLRMHLGLSNTKDTFLRVDKEIRQWEVGKVLMFDDSFEHEVWHNGTGARLVLIVDVWHPQLTAHERRTLPAI